MYTAHLCSVVEKKIHLLEQNNIVIEFCLCRYEKRKAKHTKIIAYLRNVEIVVINPVSINFSEGIPKAETDRAGTVNYSTNTVSPPQSDQS